MVVTDPWGMAGWCDSCSALWLVKPQKGYCCLTPYSYVVHQSTWSVEERSRPYDNIDQSAWIRGTAHLSQWRGDEESGFGVGIINAGFTHINVQRLVEVWLKTEPHFLQFLDPIRSRNDGFAIVFRWPGRYVPAVDQSQRSRLCDHSPEVDICLFVSPAALRHIWCVLLCAGMADLQDVLCAQTARPACERHPATGEQATISQSVSRSVS